MRKITPVLCVLWILSSAGIAGIVVAMAQKPQTTTIQKTKPIHNINKIGKSDKYKPQPSGNPFPKWTRKHWYA